MAGSNPARPSGLRRMLPRPSLAHRRTGDAPKRGGGMDKKGAPHHNAHSGKHGVRHGAGDSTSPAGTAVLIWVATDHGGIVPGPPLRFTSNVAMPLSDPQRHR